MRSSPAVRHAAERRPPGRLGSGLRAVAVAGLALVAATAPASAPGIVPPGLSAALEREADLLMATHQPEGVVVLVLDARTGVVLARAVRGGVGERRMAPGSVLKPFVVAAALEAGIPESAQLADGDMASILERSSNAGAVGSEMCIRDRACAGRPAQRPAPGAPPSRRCSCGWGCRRQRRSGSMSSRWGPRP